MNSISISTVWLEQRRAPFWQTTLPPYRPIVDQTLQAARKELGKQATPEDVAKLAFDRLAIGFGLQILQIVPGRVSTEVDARLSYDTHATIDKARYLKSP